MKNAEEKKISWTRQFIFLLGVAVIVFIGTQVFKETYNKKQIQGEIDKLRLEAESIDKENSKIRDRIVYLESRDYQEKEAKDKLNMQNPDENLVIVKQGIVMETNVEEVQIAESEPKASEASNYTKWWNYFFKS